MLLPYSHTLCWVFFLNLLLPWKTLGPAHRVSFFFCQDSLSSRSATLLGVVAGASDWCWIRDQFNKNRCHICFYFHPYLGNISNSTNIFRMGWNHQLALFLYKYLPCGSNDLLRMAMEPKWFGGDWTPWSSFETIAIDDSEIRNRWLWIDK